MRAGEGYRRAGDAGTGGVLAIDEAAETVAGTGGESRVALADQLGGVVGGHGQRGLVDGVAAAVAPGESVVADIAAGQRHRALIDGLAGACTCTAPDRRAEHAYGITADHATQRAVACHAAGHRGAAVIGLGQAAGARQR